MWKEDKCKVSLSTLWRKVEFTTDSIKRRAEKEDFRELPRRTKDKAKK